MRCLTCLTLLMLLRVEVTSHAGNILDHRHIGSSQTGLLIPMGPTEVTLQSASITCTVKDLSTHGTLVLVRSEYLLFNPGMTKAKFAMGIPYNEDSGGMYNKGGEWLTLLSWLAMKWDGKPVAPNYVSFYQLCLPYIRQVARRIQKEVLKDKEIAKKLKDLEKEREFALPPFTDWRQLAPLLERKKGWSDAYYVAKTLCQPEHQPENLELYDVERAEEQVFGKRQNRAGFIAGQWGIDSRLLHPINRKLYTQGGIAPTVVKIVAQLKPRSTHRLVVTYPMVTGCDFEAEGKDYRHRLKADVDHFSFAMKHAKRWGKPVPVTFTLVMPRRYSRVVALPSLSPSTATAKYRTYQLKTTAPCDNLYLALLKPFKRRR